MSVKPRVDLFCLCGNDALILPHFFRHYDPWVDRYVMFVHGSADGTRAMLESHPRTTVREFGQAGESYGDLRRRFSNTAWQESRGRADWVILVDVDEFVFHPELLDYLGQCAEQGFTAMRAMCYDMVAADFPADDVPLVESVTLGTRAADKDRLCVFNPDALTATGFDFDRVTAAPAGVVKWADPPELLLLEYRYLGAEYMIQRTAELRTLLQPDDLSQPWSEPYLWNAGAISHRWATLWSGSDPVPGLDDYWHGELDPEDAAADALLAADAPAAAAVHQTAENAPPAIPAAPAAGPITAVPSSVAPPTVTPLTAAPSSVAPPTVTPPAVLKPPPASAPPPVAKPPPAAAPPVVPLPGVTPPAAAPPAAAATAAAPAVVKPPPAGTKPPPAVAPAPTAPAPPPPLPLSGPEGQAVLAQSGLFDAPWYLATQPDVAAAGVDALGHFFAHGWHEDRRPNFYFHPKWYLAHNPDAAAGGNPLVHYVLRGEPAGAAPSPWFEPAWYRQHYALAPGVGALQHYMAHRFSGRFSPNPRFDVERFCREHPHWQATGRDPFQESLVVPPPAQSTPGAAPVLPAYDELVSRLGFDPRRADGAERIANTGLADALRLFLDSVEVDEDWYRHRYPDVAAAIDMGNLASARQHFVQFGYFEGRDPRAAGLPNH